MKPNEHLKAMMKGRRKSLALYNKIDNDDVQAFLNAYARWYAKDKKAAVMFMVAADRDLKRKTVQSIKA